jgi:hypothetical protein
MDMNAGVRVSELMSEKNMADALRMCTTMSAEHVSYALCHGLGVQISGGRSKLLDLTKTRLAKHFLSHTPAFPVLPLSGVGNRPMLRGILESENSQLHDLICLLDVYKQYNYDGDVVFFGRERTPDMSNIRQNAIIRAANQVLETMNAIYASQPVPELYISAVMSDEARMDAYMTIAASTLALKFSTYAKSYIMLYIRIKHFIMRRNRIVDLLHVDVSMKALKTVITCCSAPSTPPDTPDTCSVCFENLAPSAVVRTGCNHTFCADCIGDWAKQRGIKSFIQCPCCRTEIDNIAVYHPDERAKVELGLAPR